MMIPRRLWLILSLSAAAPLNSKVNKEDYVLTAESENTVIVNGDDILDDGLHSHNSKNEERGSRFAFYGGDVSFSGEVSFSGDVSSSGDNAHINSIKVASFILSDVPEDPNPSIQVPVDCQWSAYTDWSSCSASCGDGTRQRERNIETPAKDGGNPCVGENVETEPCNTGTCTVPVDCQWSEYTDWSSCSASCGDGIRQRERNIVTPAKDGGNPCVGERVETERCNTGTCTGLKNEEKFPCSFNDDKLVATVDSNGQLSPHDTSTLFQWENNIIPYFFTSTSEKDKKLFRSVMDIIEGKTCFKFEEKAKAEYKDKHSLEIETGSISCSVGNGGNVAKVPYYNRLKLRSETQLWDKDHCESESGGFILHELMHSLGVGHTMRRSDRNDYIIVNEENVKYFGVEKQFKKCSECTLYPDVPYDCNSIMHYGTHFRGREVFKPKDPNQCGLTEKSNLLDGPKGSDLDWKLLNIIGKCDTDLLNPDNSVTCLTSPGHPNNYPHNSDTTQTLSVEDGKAIEITFHHFDVEADNTCSYDYLQLSDENSKPIGKKMCGQSLPEKLTIPTSTASAHFYSDGYVKKGGYKFCYEAADSFTECFTSPGYPNNYPHNSDTKLTLSVEDGQAIEITFVHFDVEAENECSYDYLQFLDANSNMVGKIICGESLPQKLTISTSTASAVFYSDGSVNKKGYKFCYKPVKPVCIPGNINSVSCVCKSATGDYSEEVCSTNQGCTEEGACYDVCIPGPYIVQADCFCEEKSSGRGQICTEGLKCGDGGCLNEEAKESCSFDDDLLEPKVMPDGQLSPHDTSELFKWENNVIPYYFKYDSPILADKDLIRSVMDRIEEKTCFKFEEKNKEEYENKHSLEIAIEDVSCDAGCVGAVKKVRYKNKLELYLSAHITDDFAEDCGYRGLLIHELMHALGVGHTQRRKDRDNFITVKFENLAGKNEKLIKQYKKCENCKLYDGIPYDCGSIMHYGTHINGKEVIVPKENCQLGRFPLLFSVWDAPKMDYELLNIIGNCLACNGPPASTTHGSWTCTSDLTSCQLICTSGYTPAISNIECINGQWDTTSNYICAPNMYLLAGGFNAQSIIELYHPTLGSTSCKSPPPQLVKYWRRHTSFYHDNTIYLCGGDDQLSTCCSLNPSSASSWTDHTLPSPVGQGLSSLVFNDKVVFVGGKDFKGNEILATFTTLPLSSSPTLTPVPNLSYLGSGQCVAKLSATSFIISGGYFNNSPLSTVLVYNLETESVSSLAPLSPPRDGHSCITVQQEGKMWLIVTGGWDDKENTLASTQRLDIDANKWEELGDLKEARYGHTMINSESKGVMVLAGLDGDNKDINSVERLVEKEWKKIEPSLETARDSFGGAVEVPAHLFSCQPYL